MPFFPLLSKNIFVVSNKFGCYNFIARLIDVRIQDLEKALYDNEEFMEKLSMLQQKNWDKAKPEERLAFFGIIQKQFSALNPKFSQTVAVADLDGFGQRVLFGTKNAVFEEELFKNKINPYSILFSYIFEIVLDNYLLDLQNNDFSNEDVDAKFVINFSDSNFTDSWSNYYDRKSEKFYYQPITYKAYDRSKEFLYRLLQYMNNNYGMDDYIGSEISSFMLESFAASKKKKKVEENYKIMEENYKLLDEEADSIESLFDYVDSIDDFSKLTDDEFYFLFNIKLMDKFDAESRLLLYKEFISRALKDFGDLETLLNDLDLCDTDEGSLLCVNDEQIPTRVESELGLVMELILSIKFKENILFEIESEEAKKEIVECYKCCLEIMDESGAVNLPYLANALPHIEAKNYIVNYYYNKIQNSINNNDIFKGGYPLLINGDFSKYDAYLEYMFNKNYEEVRKLQFEQIKKDYEIKKGGRR